MPATTSKTKAAAKPYDRPAGKGKGKASTETGAPAQPKQSSRKGKKAWRKNVDITAEEQALEAAREEERVTGGKVESRSNESLFTIDTEGDVAMGERLRRKKEKKPLRSLAILSERSAVPSLTSRSKKAEAAPKPKLSGREKARLRKMALKAEAESGREANIRATDVSSLHDAWGKKEASKSLPGGWGDEGVIKPKVKTPETIARQRALRRAVDQAQLDAELPRAGVSYNPSADAHQALLDEAISQEMGLLAAEAREEAEIAARGGAVDNRKGQDDFGEDMVGGMRVELVEDEEEENDEAKEEAYKPKPTKRKTQAQRNKAARAKAALLEAREEANRRRMERQVGAAKSMSKSVAAKVREAEEAAQQRRAAAKARERIGFAGGEKIGKHRVQKAHVAVQLGEDLAESLRQIKPEGNLFKDRFQSLQRRALVEPRVPQLPKKRKVRVKEYEKFAWKRFE